MLVITWDEPKRLKTIRERGLDFSDLDETFFLNSLVLPAKQGRLMAIGPFLDGVIAILSLSFVSKCLEWYIKLVALLTTHLRLI